MTQKTGDNKRKGDIKVKVDRQGDKGVKQSAKGDETIEGWWWRRSTRKRLGQNRLWNEV